MQSFSRRRALQLGSIGLASIAVGAAGLTWRTLSGETPAAQPAWLEPSTLTSADGLLTVRLEAAEGPVHIAGRQATALRYNGSLPGPTLRLRPGDRLRVQLVNRLAEVTNLHVHGLHVSPEGKGDNAFVAVEPGSTFDYEHQLPHDHPSGTFWYHPHHHGMVADQIFGGLYGAIIVDEREAELGPMPITRERVLIISDISLDSVGNIRPPSAMARMRGREGDLVLVNGQSDPTLEAQPGERERWRIVNACTARYLLLRLDGQGLRLLGIDSGHLADPRDVEEILLVPGNRADLLVTTAEGTSRLQAVPYSRGQLMGMGGGMGDNSQRGDSTGLITLATLQVTGAEVTPLPPVTGRTQHLDLRERSLAAKRELTLEMGMMGMGGGGMSFTIDGKEFDQDRVDWRARSGTIEEWTITNTSPMDHPIHLHVWPMLVIEENGKPIEQPTWRDVVNVPANSNVKVRILFDDFAGRTVYHCHILDHEDQGMMGVLEVGR